MAVWIVKASLSHPYHQLWFSAAVNQTSWILSEMCNGICDPTLRKNSEQKLNQASIFEYSFLTDMTSPAELRGAAVSIAGNSKFFAAAFPNSFSIFSIDPFMQMYAFPSEPLIAIAVNFDATKTAIAVSPIQSDPETFQVHLWNNLDSQVERAISFPEPVARLCIRGSMLLVVLRTGICLLNLGGLEPLTEHSTSSNLTGCGDIATGGDIPKLAICDIIPGQVQILSLDVNARANFFHAHSHPISLIKFSEDGSLIATASQYGTLIRVFFTITGGIRSVFRRGALRSRIAAFAFSPKPDKLVAVSENGTVHVFSLSHRVNTFACTPRASSKCKIGRASTYDVAFLSDNRLFVAGSCGMSWLMALDGTAVSLVREIATKSCPREYPELVPGGEMKDSPSLGELVSNGWNVIG
jgi:WD40 repeat protein